MTEDIMDEIHRSFDEENRKLQEENKAVLSTIKSMVDDSFFKALTDFLSEQYKYYGAYRYELVKKPTGEYQKEFWHNKLQGFYCQQWSVGDSGDSYGGYIYVKITKNNYIKIHFSC